MWVLSLLACEASLEEGVYGCVTGECPPNWSCRADGLCYRAAGPPRSCNITSAAGACPEGRLCTVGPDRSVVDGVCVATCNADEDCPRPTDAPPNVCVDGACLPGCDSGEDCFGPAGCHVIADGPGGPDNPGPIACYRVENEQYNARHGCTSMDCGTPAFCVRHDEYGMLGVCSIRCTTDTECPLNSMCAEVFQNYRHCVAPCREDSECFDGLVCGNERGEGSRRVCLPPEWVGLLPLPPPPMRPRPMPQ